MTDLFDIDRMEFIVTKRCTGWCKHCSVMTADRNPDRSYVNPTTVMAATAWIYSRFQVESMMVYGGEPLLYPETVVELYRTARDCGVPRRELITNGYFSRNEDTIDAVATALLESGANCIMVSVDAFHQPRIPLPYVETFIATLLSHGCDALFLHPSWVVSREHDNPYNSATEQILDQLSGRHAVHVSAGNNIIPAGYFRHTLSEYYPRYPLTPHQRCDEVPYANSPTRVRSLRILPTGDVRICRGISIGNINDTPMEELLTRYNPYSDPAISPLLSGGLEDLVGAVRSQGVDVDPFDYYGRCDLCAECIRSMRSPGAP